MSRIPEHLEPVPRDPVKLRRTAWILVGIMIVGGAVILTAYNRWAKKHADDNRPAIITRLTKEKDLPVLRQDASRAGLFDLNGKVSIAHTISISQPETSAIPVEVVKRLVKHYADNPDFVVTSLVLDPGPPETAAATLATAAGTLGAELPKWWVATTEPEVLHKYVKKEFKATLLPRQVDGRWVHDTSLVLIDRNRHIRHAVVPQKRGGEKFVATFDFDQATDWDKRGVKTGTDLTNAEQLEALLIETIDILLAEPFQN